MYLHDRPARSILRPAVLLRLELAHDADLDRSFRQRQLSEKFLRDALRPTRTVLGSGLRRLGALSVVHLAAGRVAHNSEYRGPEDRRKQSDQNPASQHATAPNPSPDIPKLSQLAIVGIRLIAAALAATSTDRCTDRLA
jgi:hypothetical protein